MPIPRTETVAYGAGGALSSEISRCLGTMSTRVYACLRVSTRGNVATGQPRVPERCIVGSVMRAVVKLPEGNIVSVAVYAFPCCPVAPLPLLVASVAVYVGLRVAPLPHCHYGSLRVST